ncbi:MAG: phosphocholine cytidylyltransferase family protein [Candidatus Binatia bacterium]|nr:phosphocholine cytidylyltransferase family protein [Candidatus Binatia bacterium]
MQRIPPQQAMDRVNGRNGTAGSSLAACRLRKAIILNAGQGRRLLPLTAATPKCLLPVDGHRTILELQLNALTACGIENVVVIVGFGADKIAHFLSTHAHTGLQVTTRYNPFFQTANNLVSCWIASAEMTEDFLLLNGDTLFAPAVLHRLLSAPPAPVTLAIDRKPDYDDDDMKVTLEGGRQLRAIGKSLDPSQVHGESIGLMTFRGPGVSAFRTALAKALDDPAGQQQWYLAVIDRLARSSLVEVVSIEGLWWTEIDTPADLVRARAHFERERVKSPYTAEPSYSD